MDIFTYATLQMELIKRVKGVARLTGSLLLSLMPSAWRVNRAESQAASLFVTIALLAAGITASAQTYPFREYTSDDGLPQTQSLSMMQDSRGYLWIPTRNGLARFNGYTFVSYLRKDGLPSNIINKVAENKNGIIWALTLNGVARFNGKSFYSYPLPDSAGIKQLGGACVFIDTSSILLNGSIDYDHRVILLFENGKYSNFTASNPALKDIDLEVIGANPKDTAIYLIDDRHRAFTYHRGVLTLAHDGPVTDVCIVNDEPQFGDLAHMKPPLIEPFFWERGNISLYFTDREGTIWTGTETSIYRLISDAFVEYDRTAGLGDETWALAADPRGGIWTGTVLGDLKYFDGTKFSDKNEYQKQVGKPGVFYRGSATLSNGEIWFSTEDGVISWDGTKFKVEDFAYGKSQVCIIYEDPVDKSIFVGTDRGLYHIIGDDVTYYPQMSWPGYGIVEGITRDHNGNHWLAGHYGVVFFDGSNFVPLRSAPAPAEMAWGIICDYKGNIWTAGSDGIFICESDEQVFNQVLPEKMNMPANVIRDMGDHHLIVGRMMDICIINLEKYYAGLPNYYTIIDRSRGFQGNDCQDNGIVKDADGQWWILTTDRLIRFDPDRIRKNTTPPMNHITLVEVEGDTTEWETALDASLFYDKNSFLKIRGRKNGIRISYTGISTQNPENVMYRHRLNGLTDSWSGRTTDRIAVFDNLKPGNYTFEVQAINADGVFSENPDSLIISVVPTFFQSTFAIVSMVILTLGLIVFLSLQIRKSVLERRIEEARKQAETYRLQLNSVIRQFDPHFTFNAVTSVGSLIMKGEKEKAYNYFIKLSNLLRSIITDSNLLLKPLEEELEFVKRYCELQQLRFGNRFQYNIEVAPDVNLKAPVPKMIIQSFAENAIKHGLENKKGQGIVKITVTGSDSGLELKIRDNGIGRIAAARLHTGGAGTGLKNINGIVETVNKANREKITFTLTDLYDEGMAAGTEVTVFLPHNYSFNLPAEKSSD